MGTFTIIPAWIIQNVLGLTVAAALYIVKREEHPGSVLLEMVCFVFLYAAVYENFATLMGWYGYGRSLVMVFNVPLSVPVVEYLVVWATLRLASRMEMPTWSKPFVAGLAGMLFDFSLDPLALRQVAVTAEGAIGRWTWFPGPGDVTIYAEPVYNFSGWMLLCGYAAAYLLIGRWWHRRSGYRPLVGNLYPILGMLLALGTMVSPLSKFLLWLEPLLGKGSVGEWIMLGVHLAVPALLLALVWRGRMKGRLSWRDDWPLPVILAGVPVVHLAFTRAGAYWDVLWLVIASTALLGGMVIALFAGSARAPLPARRHAVPRQNLRGGVKKRTARG
ncbi:MAG: hypothetical protein A2177_02665 [Spirochaetes bacterium RBG_13_68_11]|nr:MAG: hypothetical protein A2177_02665 [Spirochaetes bacterium RBG_13_68_11]